MSTLAVNIETKISGTHVNAGDLQTATAPILKDVILALTNGVGANQADLYWSDTRTLTTGAADSIDLAGVLTDPAFGNVLTFARIKAIFIWNKLAANKQLVVGGGSNPWIGAGALATKINPGGAILLTSPDATAYPVVAGTGDILTITNASGGDSTYDIIIIGASS